MSNVRCPRCGSERVVEHSTTVRANEQESFVSSHTCLEERCAARFRFDPPTALPPEARDLATRLIEIPSDVDAIEFLGGEQSGSVVRVKP